MHALFWLIDTLLAIAFWIILIQVIMSWLINFNVINLYQPIVRQIWDALNALTAPIYRPLRKILPPMGGFDFAPMVVILAIYFLRIFIGVDLARAIM
jgi:YggT family protein